MSVKVSPDGKNVYAVVSKLTFLRESVTNQVIVRWDRDLDTGALSNQVNKITEDYHYMFDLMVSPDGKNVYAVGAMDYPVLGFFLRWDRKVPLCEAGSEFNNATQTCDLCPAGKYRELSARSMQRRKREAAITQKNMAFLTPLVDWSLPGCPTAPGIASNRSR